MTEETPILATPEWVTARRTDRLVDERVTGGWVATLAPPGRGAAYTDFTSHVISVPGGDSQLAVGIRAHELTHARYSPTTVPASLMQQMNLPVSTVRVAEEFRINRLSLSCPDPFVARHTGLTDEQLRDREEMVAAVRTMTDGTESAAADHAVKTDDFRSAVHLMFSTFGLDCFRVVKRRLRRKEEWRDAIGSIAKHLTRNYSRSDYLRDPSWSATHPVQYSWKEGHATRSEILPMGFTDATLSVANLIETIVSEGGIGRGRIGKKDGEGDPEYGKPIKKDKGELTRRRDIAEWCGLRLGITSLTDTTASFIGRRKRPSITGKFPVRPDRLLTDPERRIFRTEVRGNGGIVVFDCSGSMGVDYQVIRDAVAQFAGATVVAYSYNGATSPNFWVLAKGGRMVSAESMEELPLNNGNGVDGMALRWAIRERSSRREFILWVSDLGVTGAADAFSYPLLSDCADLCRKHGIMQVHDSHEALELLAEMKRQGGFPRNRWSPQLQKVIAEIEAGKRSVPLVSVAEEI